MKDLVLVVADKDAQYALKGALDRPEALGIRNISFDFRMHPGRDGGVRKTGVQMLAVERARFSHGLLLFDYEGSGSEQPAAVLESELDGEIRTSWGDRGKAIVITPEVDAWIWGSNNALEEAIGWKESQRVRDYLQSQGYSLDSHSKPLRPKEAFDSVLVKIRTPHSSALYEKVARKLSIRRCVDPSFKRLLNQLQLWFGCSEMP